MPLNRREVLALPGTALLMNGGASAASPLRLHQKAGEAERDVAFRHRVGSIDWYCERRGKGPALVLIPSGEGDCGSFGRVASSLAEKFTVLTFDMPGFSRSGEPPNFEDYSMAQAASEVAALVRSLELEPATFYGCSSGGAIALSLVSGHSDLVRLAIVHEVPLRRPGNPSQRGTGRLASLSDVEIVSRCKDISRNISNADPSLWDALGSEFHERLERNYVTWVRRYGGRVSRSYSREELRRRPIVWTVGGLSPAAWFIDNVLTACEAGIEIGLLPCKHFPQVSIPDRLAEHINEAASA